MYLIWEAKKLWSSTFFCQTCWFQKLRYPSLGTRSHCHRPQVWWFRWAPKDILGCQCHLLRKPCQSVFGVFGVLCWNTKGWVRNAVFGTGWCMGVFRSSPVSASCLEVWFATCGPCVSKRTGTFHKASSVSPGVLVCILFVGQVRHSQESGLQQSTCPMCSGWRCGGLFFLLLLFFFFIMKVWTEASL